jgi:hypothetical protein
MRIVGENMGKLWGVGGMRRRGRGGFPLFAYSEYKHV